MSAVSPSFCRHNDAGDANCVPAVDGEEGEDGDATGAAAEGAGAEPGAAAKKKKKKKKKKAGGSGGVPTCPGGTGSKVAPARGVKGFTDSYVRYRAGGLGCRRPTTYIPHACRGTNIVDSRTA